MGVVKSWLLRKKKWSKTRKSANTFESDWASSTSTRPTVHNTAGHANLSGPLQPSLVYSQLSVSASELCHPPLCQLCHPVCWGSTKIVLLLQPNSEPATRECQQHQPVTATLNHKIICWGSQHMRRFTPKLDIHVTDSEITHTYITLLIYLKDQIDTIHSIIQVDLVSIVGFVSISTFI